MTFVLMFTAALLILTSCASPGPGNEGTAAGTVSAASNTADGTEPSQGAAEPVIQSSADSGNANEGITEASGQTSTSSVGDIDASNTGSAGDIDANSAGNAGAGDTGSASSPTVGSLTLESVKKAAQDAGYETEDMTDIRQHTEPSPVKGFFILYQDEHLQAQVPVYEFSTPEAAQEYARQVNESGYNLCIANGRILTLTSTSYGVVVNDKENALLETLLQSKVMAYTEAPAAAVGTAKDYAEAYLQIDTILKALNKLVNKSVLLHDKGVPEGERIEAAFITFSLVSSGDLSFTAELCEDQARLDALVKTWELFGATDMKLAHDAPHDYILKGKRAGLDTTFELHCRFDPATGSLSLKDTDGGELLEWYEFVPLGGGKYAFQTLYERAVVEYRDGKIPYFIYSQNTRSKEFAYDPGKDGIFGKKSGMDEAWVEKGGEDSHEQFLRFDGTKIKIAANTFDGKRFKAEIAAQ
jgi:hypothetical protein